MWHLQLTRRLFFLFDPNTWERRTNHRLEGCLPHYSRLHVWLQLGENPLKGSTMDCIWFHFQSPSLITHTDVNLSLLHNQDSHWYICFWYIWWHHKVLWTTEKSAAGIYATNVYNLSSEVIPEDYVKAIGVGWPWLLLVWKHSRGSGQTRRSLLGCINYINEVFRFSLAANYLDVQGTAPKQSIMQRKTRLCGFKLLPHLLDHRIRLKKVLIVQKGPPSIRDNETPVVSRQVLKYKYEKIIKKHNPKYKPSFIYFYEKRD